MVQLKLQKSSDILAEISKPQTIWTDYYFYHETYTTTPHVAEQLTLDSIC